ncbi:phragmoplast orienting kinesin [Trifolium repens]|nr:phragmoplast orienting kinesin [Trifolium repens]
MEVEGSVEEKEEGDEEEKTEAETEEKEERRVMKRRKLMQRRRRRKWAMKRIKLKQRQRRKMVKIILRNQKKKIRQGIVRVRKDRKSMKEGWLFWFGPLNEVYMPHDYYISHSSGNFVKDFVLIRIRPMYYGEAFARKWKVLETGKCADFDLAWSS